MKLPSTGEVLDLIWRKLAFPPPADETQEKWVCWLWHGQVSHNDVPTLRIKARDGKVHAISPGRYLWQLEFQRQLPATIQVRRTCGVPRCVNPYHAKVSDEEYRTTGQDS